MSPEPFKKMILCWQKIIVSQHEIVTLRLMENVQFLILFWPQQSHDSCGAFSRKKVSGKKRCHMAVRLLYTASNYLRKCCLTYTDLFICPLNQALCSSNTHFLPVFTVSVKVRKQGIFYLVSAFV